MMESVLLPGVFVRWTASGLEGRSWSSEFEKEGVSDYCLTKESFSL